MRCQPDNSFTTAYQAARACVPRRSGCPAVWVGDGRHRAGRTRSGRPGERTLVLTAESPGCGDQTVWGWLEGSGNTGQNIIINTHTDGPSAVEENGGLGLLRWPGPAALPRGTAHVFRAGHGAFPAAQFDRTILNPVHPEVGQGAVSTWIAGHPDIWQAAVLGCAEHLGATCRSTTR